MAALVVLVCSAAFCYTTSINGVPTAEVLGANQLLVEFDNCGYSRPATTDSVTSIFTEFGIGSRFEIGWDHCEDSAETWQSANGKLRIFDGNDFAPAVAIGSMDLWSGSKPTHYCVLSKSIGDTRLHFGWIRGSYAHGSIAGADWDIDSGTWLGVDYIPGEANCLRFGVCRDIGSKSTLSLTYGRPNDSAFASRELGITVSTYIDLGR